MGARRLSRWVLVAAGLLLAMPAFAGGGAARRFKGKIVVSAEPIPTDFGSDAEMTRTLRKVSTTKLSRKGGEKTWTIHFMGFLNKRPHSGNVSLVFYKGRGKKREYVSARPLNIDPGVNVVASSVEVSEEDNLEAGTTYEVIIGQMVGGKEHVYARTTLTLK